MIQKTKRPISILLVLLMIVGMFSVLPISASANVYKDDADELNLNTDDIIHMESDYVKFDAFSVVLKGGTYKVAGSDEVAQSDIQFGEGWDSEGTTLDSNGFHHDDTTYVPVDANGYESGSWLVLDVNYDTGAMTFRGMSDYYLAGTMNNWNNHDGTYELAKNPENTDEYMLLDFAVDANTAFKVVGVGDWIAPTDDFTLNDAGTYDIYFRPDGSGNTADGWVDGKVYANNFRAPATYVAQIGNTKYETLEAAFAAAVDGDTITLLADCAGNGIKAPQGKFANGGLTVDFAGFTYTVDGETVGSTGTETNGFQLLKGNKIDFLNGTIYSEKAKILVQNYSNLGLYGMTLTLKNPDYTSAYTLSNNNGNAGIHNTTINANPAGGFAFDVCRYSSYPSINVEVTGNSVINGNVEISATNGDPKDGFSLILDGGTMNGDIVVDPSAQTAIENNPENAVVKKTNAFTQTAPEGFEWKNNSDGTSTLVALPYAAKIGNTKYRTLEEAFAAAVDGDTITLLSDCTGNGIKAPQGKFATKGLTVDFVDYTYTIDGETVGSTGTETNGFQLLKDNKVTFKGGTIYSEKAKILVQNYSDLTLLGMTLTLDNPNYTSAYTLSNNNGDVVIDSTTINANPAGGFAFDVCRFSSYPSVHVTVTGGSDIQGDVEISASKGQAKDGFSLTLESGTMTGNIVVDASAQALVGEDNKVTKKDTFTQEAPAGFKWVSNEDGTASLAPIPYVAKIGNTKYETLADAFAAAVDGDTITLLANCAGNGIKVTPAGKFADKGLTVDFAGFTYTVDGETVGSTGTETNGFQLLKNNKVTFQNGTITSAKAKILVQNYSDLTLDKMTLTLDNPNYASAYTLSNNNGDVVINNTTINANPAGGFAFDVCRFSSYPSVNVKVTGESVINGDVEISASKGDAKEGFSLTLESGSMSGNIVVDASAQALVGNNNKVTKANTFTQEAPADFRWVDNGDGTSTLAPIPYVAKIGTTKYETLEAAFAAAQDEDTITVLADCEGNGIVAPQGKFATGLTVDFNGHTYDVSGTPVGSTGTETIGFQLLKGNKITFKNGTITGDSRITRTNTYLLRMIQNYSDLTLVNMTVSMVGQYYDQITVSTCNGETVIKDSTISAPDYSWANITDPADVGAAALAVGTFASYPSIDVTVEGNSVIKGDVNVTDDNNKKAFSLKLNGGELNGKINLDENAKAAIDDTTSTANVTKADSFNQEAPAGYEWVDNGNGTGSLGVVDYDLAFDKDSYTINCGSTTTVKVSGTKDGVALNNVGYAEVKNRWNFTFSGDEALAITKTSANGSAVSYTVKGLKVGTYTATLTDSLGLIAPITTTVTVNHYASPTLSGTTPRLVETGPYTFTALKFDGETVDLNDYTFTSLDETVATIEGTTLTPLKEGSVPVKITSKSDPDATYTYNYAFTNAPVKIGDTYYQSLSKAMTAAADNDTIVVLKDFSETVSYTGAEKTATIDLNGHTITAAAGKEYAIRIDRGTWTVKDSSAAQTGGVSYNVDNGDYAFIVSHVAADCESKLILESGTFTGKTSVVQVGTSGGSGSNKKYYGGTLEVQGGTFITVPDTNETYDANGNFKYTLNKLDYNAATYPGGEYSPSEIIVKGGNFYKFNPSNNAAEGEGTNFVPAEYVSVFEKDADDTYTVVPAPTHLFTGHNITLRGDVSLNFFIDTKAIENYDPSVPAKVVFTYDGTRTAEVAFADATPASDGVIVATIQVPAAFMAHQIKAVVYYDGAAQAETDEYSIQQYAETLIADPAAYGIPAAKVEAVKTLMKEMLNYGAKAQTVFAGQVKEQATYDDLAQKYGYHMAPVSAADIQAAIDNAPENEDMTATDLSTVKPEANATFYTSSVVFLSESTLKIVFKVPGGSTIAGQYAGSQKNTYYWVQKKDIAAAELDKLQTFTVGEATFYYSALDYAKVVLNNGNAAAKDLVSALYLYNQAANVFYAD